MSVPAPAPNPAPLLDSLEAFLRDLLTASPLAKDVGGRKGRPPLLSVFLIWSGLLVCLLRGFSAQRALWQQLCVKGLWHFPAVKLTEQAVYQRLARLDPAPFVKFFAELTALLRARYAAVNDLKFASFATEVYALDHTTLDPVLRKLKMLRDVPRGNAALMPGQLATLFDLRRQSFARVEFWPEAAANEQNGLRHWLQHVSAGTLFLFDLGFYNFRWFDAISDVGCHFVCRLRANGSFIVKHTLFAGPAGQVHLRDQLVYLGAHHSDKASHPLRLLEVRFATGTYRYLTNVLDPKLLPAAHVVEIYRRRWDIEQAFNTLKTHLNLFLLWTGHPALVQVQVWATLTLAQVVNALRIEVAQGAEVELREVSLPLMLRWLPQLAAPGIDPVAILAQRGRLGGIIRPFRGRKYHLPEVKLEDYTIPPAPPPPRKPRYAQKQRSSPSTQPRISKPRNGAFGKRARKTRSV